MKARRWIAGGVIIILSIFIMIKAMPQLGANSKGDRLRIIKSAPNYKDGKFQNQEPTSVQAEDMPHMKVMREWFRKDTSREPSYTLPVTAFDSLLLDTEQLQYAWLGHSSIFLSDGAVSMLVDPVFSGSASPLPFIGPTEFEYSNAISAEILPLVDAILITHDHYDHLDHETIEYYSDKVNMFIVPLGVGAHLERWGVDASKITECNWYDTINYKGVELTALPARHFSGRGLVDRDKTLWLSWMLRVGDKLVYLSGDSGYGNHYKEINSMFGKVDLAFMECGQYNQWWPSIHMMPEETVQACIEMQVKTAVPIHWGKFSLSLHSWTDPVERFVAEAELHELNVALPVPGSLYTADFNSTNEWWKP